MIELANPLERLPKPAFVRAWCAIAYLYPGLHPDGYDSADSGWPRGLRRFAAEAWRRANAGELTDSELYCYQPCKACLRRERAGLALVAPWLLSDHSQRKGVPDSKPAPERGSASRSTVAPGIGLKS